MRRLEINNFLTINHVDIEILPLTILIGEQAQGKSIIAKLAYYLERVFTHHILLSYLYDKDTFDLVESAKEDFIKCFPKYAWCNSEFSIRYSKDNAAVNVDYVNNNLTIILNSYTEHSYSKARKESADKLSALSGEAAEKINKIDILVQNIHLLPPETSGSSIFIPAARTVFSSVLKKNVFSLIRNDIQLDHFLVEFANAYNAQIRQGYAVDKTKPLAPFNLPENTETLLCGKYFYNEEEDYLMCDHGKVLIENASSGQQEILPLLCTIYGKANYTSIVIEEPEAHLFPTSQKAIISILAQFTNLNTTDGFVFITTHSPYILSAANNHLLAGQAVDAPEHIRENINKIIHESAWLHRKQIAAYSIKHGIILDIMDTDSGLIDGRAIDEASAIIEREFSAITDAIYE